MKFAIAAIAAFLMNHPVVADELPLLGGRYPGPVLVFRLSAAQLKVIDRFESCYLGDSQRMNIYTPYVFELEKSQRAELKKKSGFSPRYFEVYQTYKGFNEAGPHWNLALQFARDKIEIPLDLLLPDEQARQAHSVQGWKVSNPCFPKARPKTRKERPESPLQQGKLIP